MAKATIDYSILDKFNFETPPVGIKFTVQRPAGIARIKEKMTLCEMLKHAQTGNVFHAEMADHTCDAGAYVLGQQDLEKPYTNGEYGAGLQVFDSPRSGARLYQHIYKIDKGIINYVAFAPLDKLTFEPDLLFIMASTTQAEIILRASSYKTGDMWLSKYTAAMGCSWLFIYPYLSGEINHITTGLGFGMRRRRMFPEGLHMISVPFDKIKPLLDTLAVMPWVPEPYKENGLEYVKNLRIRLGLEEPS
ncbi:MAG: hypothetical protein A2Y89_07025 [Chloroflexi bacterium RBG_13_51_18]|nr:MAG: hypothetical protein A2Y89_07025 [Chloroflexi bacterium RBG_13_51_18]